MIWNKVTEVMPPEGRDLLVWNGRYMLVSNVTLYTAEYVMGLRDLMGMEYCEMLTKSKGYFQEFGDKYYFDNPEVFWMELPLAPGKEPKIEDPFEGLEEKNIYLKKDDIIIGLHAVGYDGAIWDQQELDGTLTRKTGFQAMESWGNHYDNEHNMLGRGSFRVFGDIEEEAKEMEADGWVRFEGPKRKEKS